jgi:AcrR family transcriptional regulator
MSSAVDLRVARGEATRDQILEAARETLRRHGGAATTTRAVAERAGVRLSLVHYHFGSRGGLLAALLERENARLLKRQQALYAAPGPLADKWRTACTYLGEDVRSGYVRVLWELWAAGLAEEDLAGRWRDAMADWRRMLAQVAEGWASEHHLQLPLPPRTLATLVANAFQGAEVELLAGVTEDEEPHFEALEVVARLIEGMDRG